ncbi:TPA: hypothetical protein EYP13_03195, partial [Candidatus Micrarchaeota archaeon]|nr:hypothetical protein [Candidatus Micrarchaeota archaeon]
MGRYLPVENWWADNVQDVAIKLGTDIERGLSEEEARRRLEEHGENRIETGKEVNPVKIFLRQFRDP